MEFFITYIQVILKMTLNLTIGLAITFISMATITEVKQDKRWLRKILNKYIMGVE